MGVSEAGEEVSECWVGRDKIVWVVDGFVVEGGEGLKGVPRMGSYTELVGEVGSEGVSEGLLYVTRD